MLIISPNRTGQTMRFAILGLALLGISAGFAPGRLYAQPGFNVPFLQSYTGSLSNGIGLPASVLSNPSPFALNSGGFSGRILGADPFPSANLGVTSGGLASGYYFDLLSDQIALRRLLPQNPGVSLGNSRLREFYINPLSPFVSGWIPGPGTSPLEERLARIQRGELVAPDSVTESQADSPADSTESADARRVAKKMVLPAPAAEVEISEAVLELDSVPDTDAKVTAAFPPPPRGFAARGLTPRSSESVEPFSALRFAMRDWSTTPFMPLRPGLYGVARTGDESDYRGVPDEFAVPSNPVNGPAALDPPLILAASPKSLPPSNQTVLSEVAVRASPAPVATDAVAASSPSSAVPATEVASASPPVALVTKAIASVASPKAPSAPSQSAPQFDPAAIHQLASSSDALELALAGVRPEPVEPFAPEAAKPSPAITPPASTLASGASLAPNSTSEANPIPTPVARRESNAVVPPTAASVPEVPVPAAPSVADVAQAMRRLPSSPQPLDRSKFDFEGSTAAIDGMLSANESSRNQAMVRSTTVTPPNNPAELASNRPTVRETPASRSTPAAATVASRTEPRSPARNSTPLASSRPAFSATMERTVDPSPVTSDRGLLAAILGLPPSRAQRPGLSASASTTRPPAARSATAGAAATVASRTPPVAPSASSMAAAAARNTLPSTASSVAGNSAVRRASGNQAAIGSAVASSPTYANNPSRGASTNGSSAYRSPTYGAATPRSPTYSSPTYSSPTYGAVAYNSPVNGGVVYGQPGYGGVVYASPTTDRATERRSSPSTGRSPIVSTRPSAGASSGTISSGYAVKPSKSFTQWRTEQLTEANRLIAEGERARLNGKSNTARLYFQQAQRIRDTVAALP